MYPDQAKIEKMKKAADICSNIFSQLIAETKAGKTLMDLENLASKLCRENNVIPAFKGYEGFPAILCVSPNDIVVHGIPDETVIKEGDVLGIDFGLKYQDVFSDMSYTVVVGGYKDEKVKQFVETVKKATLAGIEQAKPGNTVGDIGAAMQAVVEGNGYSVVREMVGHGIGYQLHEDPYIPGYGKKGKGERLYKGQTLAIEAIVNQGAPDIFIDSEDGWTTFTEDGMLSAIFEHTIVVDEDPVILTKW